MQHQGRSTCQLLLPSELVEPEKTGFSFRVLPTKLIRTCAFVRIVVNEENN